MGLKRKAFIWAGLCLVLLFSGNIYKEKTRICYLLDNNENDRLLAKKAIVDRLFSRRDSKFSSYKDITYQEFSKLINVVKITEPEMLRLPKTMKLVHYDLTTNFKISGCKHTSRMKEHFNCSNIVDGNFPKNLCGD